MTPPKEHNKLPVTDPPKDGEPENACQIMQNNCSKNAQRGKENKYK